MNNETAFPYIRFARLDARFFELHVIHKEKYMRVCLISIKLEPFYVVEERLYCPLVLNDIQSFRCYIESLSKMAITKKKQICGLSGRLKLI